MATSQGKDGLTSYFLKPDKVMHMVTHMDGIDDRLSKKVANMQSLVVLLAYCLWNDEVDDSRYSYAMTNEKKELCVQQGLLDRNALKKKKRPT